MATLTVGSGEQFQTIAAAVAASHDGDVLQVQAGTYVNDFAEISTKITLEGVGGMVNMVATEPIPNGKAILITDTDVTIDDFSFSGATVADANGAGIRYQGGNLTIENSSFSDNQDGLLAADNPTGSITIENSVFSGNGVGGDGHTHNIYVGDVGQLTINDSLFTGAIIGHEIKSRAENTTITDSRIIDGPGTTSSYEIDLPNGGNAVITNDVIEQGAASQNPVIISYGEEGNLRANSSLTVTGTTILNDLGSSSAVAVRNSTSATATLSNDKIYGLTAGQILNGTGSVSGLTYLTTEPALDFSSPIQIGTTSPTPTPTPTPAPTPTPTPVANPTTGLVLDISEDAYLGDAQYTISVDGQQIGGVMTASALHGQGQTQPVNVDDPLSAGAHTVTVDFLNDAYGGSASADRNLYVDGAFYNGLALPNSTLDMVYGGSQNFNVTVPGTPTPSANPTTGLVLDISEDAYLGDAQYTISVDGEQIGGIMTASASHAAGQAQAVPVNAVLTAGEHTVGVDFLNDLYAGTPSTDRNLYVDSATLNGNTIPGSTITLLSAGTATFAVTMPTS